MANPFVIVGAGQAGAQAAQTLRQLGYDGDLVLLGDEPHAPYQRSALSKDFLAGDVSAEKMLIRPADFYAENKIDFRAGMRAEKLDPVAKSLEFGSGEELRYEKILMCTGTRARERQITGGDLDGIISLRLISDVEYIRPMIEKGARLVIVGGGYIGLEVAAVARSLGLDVTVIDKADHVMQRIVSPTTSKFFEQLHRDNGVDIRLNESVKRFSGSGRVETVRLESGELIDADLVLMTIGAVPNDELATEAGIATDDGIIVDATGHSTTPDVYAAGDCARFFSALYGREIRLESVQNAIDQAKVAAAAMLGQPVHYNPVPTFWSQQYDVKLQIAGLSQFHKAARVVGDPAAKKFAVYYSHRDRLFAVDAINNEALHKTVVDQIGKAWTPEMAL